LTPVLASRAQAQKYETRVPKSGVCVSVGFGVHPSVGRVSSQRSSSRRSIQFDEAGDRTDSARSHQRAHRRLPSRCARAWWRVRRWAAHPWPATKEEHQTRGEKRVLGFCSNWLLANESRFPQFNPVRETGDRTDNVLLTPACSSPHSISMHPRDAARSSMSRASWRRRRRPSADPKRSSSPVGSQRPGASSPHAAARHAIPRRAAGRRRVCASLSRSFTAGVAL